MRYRYFLTLVLVFVLLQYLVLSEMTNAILLPELGLIIIIIGRGQFDKFELLAAALFAGYIADVIGAVESGSLIVGYLVAGLLITGTKMLKSVPGYLELVLSLGGGLLVFHITIGLVAAPIVFSSLIGVVIIQIFGGLLMVQINSFLQNLRRPA